LWGIALLDISGWLNLTSWALLAWISIWWLSGSAVSALSQWSWDTGSSWLVWNLV
jgi:hypothetical protein